MFKLLSAITFISLLMFSSNARSETFMMKINILCDSTKLIAGFVEEENYKLIAGGLTNTSKGDILITIYGNKEKAVVLGVDPNGFTCFLVEINKDLYYEHGIKENLLAPKKNNGPDIAL